MGEFFKTAADILIAILPDSDFGRLIALLILAFIVLAVMGRFKLEWLGTGIRHICRWLRCKVRNKHRYFQKGIVWIDGNTGHKRGTYVCRVCGKVKVER